MPSTDDEFDNLLAADGGAPKPAPRVEPTHAHEVQRAQPSVADFAAGWHIYRDPVACAAMSGLVLGVLGVFVVLRRAVFVTAASLPRVAGSFDCIGVCFPAPSCNPSCNSAIL